MERRYSRKELFRGVLGWAGDCLDGVVRRGAAAVSTATRPRPPGWPEAAGQAAGPGAPPWVRPPGAIEERAFQEACTRCDDCIRACPHLVVRKAGPELGRALAGTPVVVPRENPCLLCPELFCVEACGTGALVRPGGRPRIGTAVVGAARCYLAQGQPCDYCVKHCPETPKAIDAGPRGTAAIVHRDRCTGCGFCAQICPADAIVIAKER